MTEDPERQRLNDENTHDGKLSHKQKKALIKKEKRKQKRQALAKDRDRLIQQEEETKKHSPSYKARVQHEEEAARLDLLKIEEESRRQRELWEWSEEVFKEKLQKKKEQEERERLNRLEIERKIKEEWEERQKKEREEEEEKKKKKEKQDELLRQAREGENKEGGDWHNPLAPVQYGKEREVDVCPFFAKVGSCRFGDRCSRAHTYLEKGRTILFSGMFRHFQLDQGLCEEYDTDIVLEYEDSEVNQKFTEFFDDTLPEFKAAGRVIQFKVSCNFQPHLRGNVYVSYAREDDALKAFSQFNARWYGGKQLTGQFVDIPSWKRAICGLFGKGRCPKGKDCNFLHVFKNPTNEFSLADRDMESFTPRFRNDQYKDRYSKRSIERYRSPSRSYRKQRSRSSDRYSSRSRRSVSRDRKYNGKYSFKSRSRRSRSGSRGRDNSRSRSGSRERGHSRSRSHSSERGYSRSGHVRKSRSRSHSRGREYNSRKERYRKSHSREKELSRYKRSRSRSHSRDKDCKRSESQRKHTNKKRRYSRERIKHHSKSPSKSSHKPKKRKHSEKKRQSVSDSSGSDIEEVWVERTNVTKEKTES